MPSHVHFTSRIKSIKKKRNLPKDIERRWGDREQNLPDKVEIPRTFGVNQVAIEFIKLHVFCDTNINGTSSVVYAVIYQEVTEFHGLVGSKARLSSRGLTIPRLELIGHTWPPI